MGARGPEGIGLYHLYHHDSLTMRTNGLLKVPENRPVHRRLTDHLTPVYVLTRLNSLHPHVIESDGIIRDIIIIVILDFVFPPPVSRHRGGRRVHDARESQEGLGARVGRRRCVFPAIAIPIHHRGF